MEDTNVLKYRQYNVQKDSISNGVEMVAAISSSLVKKYFASNDYFLSSTLKDKLYNETISEVYWLERPFAETDFTSKQIIPYVFLRHKEKFFVLKRKPKQSEVRLHNKLSLGIGGHVNPIDVDNDNDLINKCLLREVEEEVAVKDSFTTSFVGIINDDNTEVGKVHIGFAFEVQIKSDVVEVNEKDKMEGEWQTLDQILDNLDKMETWSQIIINEYLLSK